MPEPDPYASPAPPGGPTADATVVPLHGPQRVRASGPEDLLALIPYLLGFQPVESLVIVMVRDQRVVLTGRIDLPQVADEVDHVAAHFTEVADRHNVDTCVAAVYTADWPLAHLVLLCLAGADELGMAMGLHCGRTADDEPCFRVLGDDGELDGPYGFDPGTSVAATEAVVAGLGVLPDRDSLTQRIAPGQREVTDAVVAAAEDVGLPDTRPERAALMERTLTRCLGAPTDPVPAASDADCALLGLLCLDLEVRDVAWLRMTRSEADRHVALWSEVARRTPPVLTAAPISLAGMAAWLEGDGAFAWCCVDRAESEHPGYGLAGLLSDILAGAVHPDLWAELANGIRAECYGG